MWIKLCESCDKHLVNLKSKCLSADVNAAFDPIYPSVLDKQNASILGCGPTVTKYTGARGKSGTSDASAETMRILPTFLTIKKSSGSRDFWVRWMQVAAERSQNTLPTATSTR